MDEAYVGEGEVFTPRRHDQLENESKKTSGASTPSRDGADTPTRKNFNEQQKQLGDKQGFIHDLTSSNMNRKYEIDRNTPTFNFNMEGMENGSAVGI
jgi:hypothetical protein